MLGLSLHRKPLYLKLSAAGYLKIMKDLRTNHHGR